jgi:GNAT superfamily N-acetyltransferase
VILIRVARVSDASSIAALTVQLGYEVAAPSLEARLARILSRSDQQFLVAERDGLLVGWVHALIAEYVESDPFVVIGGLVVDRRHRRQGIGRLLMAEAEGWARTKGCSIVRLWSSVVRTDAHRFYEGLGYTKIKTQHSFLKAIEPAGRDALRRFVPIIEE